MSADPATQSVADLENEPYESDEDEDFQLDDAQDESELSDDDEPQAGPAKKKRKTDKGDGASEDIELDSGDEVTIRKAQDKRKKWKRKKGKAVDDDMDLDDDDEGGTGGFVRTRAMKMQIQEERKPLARIDGATVDVNALWEQMNAPDSQLGLADSQTQRENEETPAAEPTADTAAQEQPAADAEDQSRHNQYADQKIKIKRTYKFAGEWITEEKIVPKDSAEAKAFLSSGEKVEYAEVDDATEDAARNVRRPLRKISRFDPNPSGTIKKSWEKQQPVVSGEGDAKGPKINTVEKSRLDWAQYVDQAGIKDELRTHSKAKEGYMGRMDFLGRMDARREEEARQARLKGM
ncbi:hypothetical protein N7532_007023 [Penicillium argentinense]|uniref:SWR1-complex protein 5 n=1 Tax=Penicillium argentinense TaxID=1131581 RepID=A0A9W9KCJ3_9EURO|nr:uncharacterized protein N7532_007023 [Penicillium argentinense]KAJ5100022.1 hypothetical protein N7532_007023 [Penicillium argentinense]